MAATHAVLVNSPMSIFGRAGLVLPRSMLAAWIGVCGVRLTQPLVDALKGTFDV